MGHVPRIMFKSVRCSYVMSAHPEQQQTSTANKSQQ